MRFNTLLWLAFSLSLIILGVICIMYPLDTMQMLAYFIGFIMVFSGVGSIIYFVQMRYVMILLDGLLSCVFGFILLFGGEEIAQNFVPLFVALWLILKGILWLIHSWRLYRIFQAINSSIGIACMGVVYLLLGVIFVIFPQALATLLSIIIGITLILSGVVGLYFWITLKRMQY
ncbi:DUF308 domain-containing protein [Helicobacter jaachi]|uniref:DUF308 domain-containing protein n=1 Tax=Helicobacter jaachi TaxID=1677920 RepID=A0A4U8TAQ4_9HELI|nr:DUF308 domain-containing protein [Helicobacter jaachi]TLD95767.1 DUF308 domain-containing protein [Helicobacter jaachi]